MIITVEGYVLALVETDKIETVRTYIKYQCDYNNETYSKHIEDINTNDVYALDDYEVCTVSGFVTGKGKINKIIKVFDWNVDFE